MAIQSDHQLVSVLDNISDTQSYNECLAQVHTVLDIYQVGHACFHSPGDPRAPSQTLWRVAPEEISIACSSLVELGKHPALVLGERQHFPFNLFDYRDLFSADRDVERLYKAFENNGVVAAYGLPVHIESARYVFVVARPDEPFNLTELLALQTICFNAVNRILQFKTLSRDTQARPILTHDQRRVLIAVAKGMDDEMISDYLSLPQEVIKLIKDQIVDMLGAANVRHAIVLALIAGEITLEDCAPDQPLTLDVRH